MISAGFPQYFSKMLGFFKSQVAVNSNKTLSRFALKILLIVSSQFLSSSFSAADNFFLVAALIWWASSAIKTKWISAWDWRGMLWDAGQARGKDEGKTRCDRAVKSGESDDVGGEDELYYCLCGGGCGDGGGVCVIGKNNSLLAKKDIDN